MAIPSPYVQQLYGLTGFYNRRSGGPAPSSTQHTVSSTPKRPNLGSLDSTLDYSRSLDPSNLTIDPGFARRNPDEAQARLTRAQFDLYEKRYVPLEDHLINQAGDDQLSERLADRAGDIAGSAFDRTGATTVRRLSRYGQSPTREQREVLGRLDDAARTTTVAGTKNAVRQQTRDLQTGLAGDLMQLGRGLSSSASRGLGQAAGLANQRDQAYEAQKAQQRNSMISSSFTGAGLGASLGAAGALGAGIGAAGGAGLGAGAGLLLAMI